MKVVYTKLLAIKATLYGVEELEKGVHPVHVVVYCPD